MKMHPASLANLVHQELKYSRSLAAQAAKLLESGETLAATARSLRIARATIRNWRDRDPKLNEAFGTFEANKTKTEAKRQRVKHFKEVAAEIVDAAREDSPDPVEAGVKAQQQAKVKEVESKPLSSEEARQKRLQLWWESDWSEEIEAQRVRLEAAAMEREISRRAGFWFG